MVKKLNFSRHVPFYEMWEKFKGSQGPERRAGTEPGGCRDMTSAGMTRRRFLRAWAVGAAGVLGALAESPWRLGSGDAEAERFPIEHLVLILRENHSYDNYFGTYPAGNGTTIGPRCQDEHPDPPHGRKAALDGVTVGKRGECHYRDLDVPNYFAYAREFVLCDNYFADIRGPSIPNYFMLMAAQAPTPDNPKGDILGKYDLPTIADRLTEKGISWRNYAGGYLSSRCSRRPLLVGMSSPSRNFRRMRCRARCPRCHGWSQASRTVNTPRTV